MTKEPPRLLFEGGEEGRRWSGASGQRAGSELKASVLDHDGCLVVSGTVP